MASALKDFLQGKWLGHPLHPAVVHVPTALWPAALVFDLLSRFGVGGNAMVKTSFYAILLGLLAVLLAVPSGLADWSEIKPDKPARRIGLYHMLLNLLAAGLWLVNLLLRVRTLDTATTVTVTQLALSAVGTAILLVSGYLGGRMVYEHGVGVVRMSHSKAKWRKLAEAGRANLPPAEEG